MNNVTFGSVLVAILFWFCIGGIVYTYFGYPLLITLLSRLRPKPKLYNLHTPSVTLLIAAYNEEIVIEEKIRNCLAIDYPSDHLQILVVTDGSSDKTPELVRKFAGQGVELLHEPERRGKMAAINRALRSARGEIVVFSDANNFYQPDTITKLVSPFEDPKIGAVSGAKVIDQGDGSLGASEGLYWKYESFVKKQESRLGSCTSVAGEILAIRKELYVAPPDNIINDDFFIAMQIVRKGYRLVYAAEAKSIERVSLTARDEVIRRTRINAGRYQAISMARHLLPLNNPLLVWQIISHKFLRPLVPFFMIGAAAANLIAVLFPPETGSALYLGSPFAVVLLGLQIIFYAIALIGTRAKNQEKQNRLARLLYIPTFLINSNFAALRGYVQFMRGQQSHMWERIQRR